jgi:adenylylsulfate kinase
MTRRKSAKKTHGWRKKSFPAAEPRTQQLPRTIAVDFDGVIAEYDGWKGTGILGPPRRDVLEALRLLHAEGWKIVIHTTRGEVEIAGYLAEHGIPHHEINRNSDYRTLGTKPVADVYWDDRAVCYSGNALRDIELIRRFRTWSGRE